MVLFLYQTSLFEFGKFSHYYFSGFKIGFALIAEYSGCLQQKIKDVPELKFYRVYFYTKRYPILYEYLKLLNKQIYDIF